MGGSSRKIAPAPSESGFSFRPVNPDSSGSCATGPVDKPLFHLDREVLRGIPLHHTLRWPRVWVQPGRYRRSHRSAWLYHASSLVEHLDVFLSHSWQTPGTQKLIALLLQTGWLHGLLGWLLFSAVALPLRLMGLVDQPFELTMTMAGSSFTASASYSLILAGGLGQAFGLLLSPYFQLRKRVCFLDIACVHQGDQELLQRGIGNIGGCLAVSEELRLLYHPSYFKSLWCVFELAAFRYANPRRKISVVPLFLLSSVLVCGLWLWLSCVGTLTLLSVKSQLTVSGSNFHLIWVFPVAIFIPLNILVYFCRKKYSEKHRLSMDLKLFQMDKLSCETDFDRELIQRAVDQWYGGEDAFTSLVRGTLSAELSMMPTPHLPFGYAVLITTSIQSLFMEYMAILYMADADSHTLGICLLSWGAYFLCAVPLNFNLIFYVSDLLASSSGCITDVAKTLAGTSTVLAWNGLSMGLATLTSWSGNIWLSLSNFTFHLIILCCVYGLPLGQSMARPETWGHTVSP